MLQWETALELMERQGANAERRANLLLRLGMMGNVDYGKAAGYFEQALKLLMESGKQEELALVHVKLGDVYAAPGTRIDIPRALEHYRKGAAVVSKLRGDSAVSLSIRIDSGIAALATRTLQTSEGLISSARAMEMAERLGDARTFSTAARLGGLLLLFAGRLTESFVVLNRAWESADGLNEAGNSYSVAWTGGSCCGFLYDFAQAQTWYERELSRPRQANATFPRRLLLGLLGRILIENGEIAAARPLLSQMPSEYVERDLGLVAFWDGRWEQAEEAWTQVREKTHRAGAREEASDLLPWLATARRVLNMTTEREALLQDALALCNSDPLEYIEMRVRPELALLYAETGRHAEAVPHLARCREIMAGGEDWRGIAARVARSEAVVATAQGSFREADAYFQTAIQVLQRYPAPFHEAETLHYWGRTLLSADESAKAIQKFEAAIDIYRRHGTGVRWIERIEADMPRAMTAGFEMSVNIEPVTIECESRFRQDGDYWTISFDGAEFRLKDARGLHCLAQLLRKPGVEFAATELVHIAGHTNVGTNVSVQADPGKQLLAEVQLKRDLGDAGLVLDLTAKAAYKRRLSELGEELAEAERFNDAGRRERLREEITFVTAELAAAVGLRGQDRRVASHLERARSMVSKRIRLSIDRIRRANPPLGEHLAQNVRTGHYCAYLPKHPINWRF